MDRLFNNRAYVTCIVLLVGIGGFLLGGLAVYSVYADGRAKDPIEMKAIPVTKGIPERDVYASARGKRYYPWWCSAGKKIAKKNIVWYKTPEEAKRAGYSIAKTCEK